MSKEITPPRKTHKKNPEPKTSGSGIKKYDLSRRFFSHPDYTVGPGIAPGQPCGSRAYPGSRPGITAGSELKECSFSPDPEENG